MADKYELQLRTGKESWITIQKEDELAPIEKAFVERYVHMNNYDYQVVKYTEEILYVASELRIEEAEEKARNAAEADKRDPYSPG